MEKLSSKREVDYKVFVRLSKEDKELFKKLTKIKKSNIQTVLTNYIEFYIEQNKNLL